jgi:D-glycero-alpha-D-manno-heptose 1-phosphate guanylyltransferase
MNLKNITPKVTGITEAIILAGGIGTRLQSVLPGIPKCLAPVGGKPFLEYVINHFQNEGIEKFIFSTGYKSEMIEEYLQNHSPGINYLLSKEKEPLGTGGAITLAGRKVTQKNALVVNGDTLFSISVNKVATVHHTCEADCTLSLKPMQNIHRYGVVELDADHSIISFKEKQFYKTGLINGGVYALNIENFLKEDHPEIFSFEKDYLEKKLSTSVGHEKIIFGVVQDQYFIDIGIPEDYQRAQKELVVSRK